MRVLLLEDDFELAKEIVHFFNSQNIQCEPVYHGSLVVSQMQNTHYDIAILDINVPGLNGLEACREIRKYNRQLPIIMLTAYSEIDDKIKAFKEGADDYLVKPFHFEELLLRVNALIRRSSSSQVSRNSIRIGDLLIDNDNLTVQRGDMTINLTPKEFKLLNILASANGRVLSKAAIAEKLWEDHIETNQNTIEVYINFLRNKIDKNFEDKLIHTKVGFGYYIKNME